jgi:hypothetical protein
MFRKRKTMWTLARYLPVSPFSLKSAAATASGGKTVLVPTPYALKMALLDATIRTRGVAEGERLFPLIRDLEIALAGPEDLVVMKGFAKIRRPLKDKTDEKKVREAKEKKHWPLGPTIAYREYVYYRDPFTLAFRSTAVPELPQELTAALLAINYIGKRGGFMQLTEPPVQMEELPAHFFELTPVSLRAFSRTGTLQMLDDCAATLTFQKVNTYSGQRIRAGKERIFRHVVLPYQLFRSSRSYSWYRLLTQNQEGPAA